MTETPVLARVLSAAQTLRDRCRALCDAPGALGPEVTHVYHPLDYAWPAFEAYARLLLAKPVETLWVGMNPGPWGMAQTGVPFGEVAAVRVWLGIDAAIGKPPPSEEHPKRPVTGLDCPRSEVSGRRVWGLFAEVYDAPQAMAGRHAVLNSNPCLFLEATGKNRTPDKLPADLRAGLQQACDDALVEVIDALAPKRLAGVGKFAEKVAVRVVEQLASEHPDTVLPEVFGVLHPSPASPAANRGWAPQARASVEAAGGW
ncbi:MAG: uracil-DNA glycosylase family protein [Planctomycetota bacterium]